MELEVRESLVTKSGMAKSVDRTSLNISMSQPQVTNDPRDMFINLESRKSNSLDNPNNF